MKMLFDYFLVASIIYGLAWLLNFKFFNQNPATKLKAFLLTLVIFIVSTALMTFARLSLYSDLGLSANKPLAVDIGILCSIIFYLRLKRKKYVFEIQTEKGGMVASFDSLEKAEEYIKNNPDKNYKIK